MSGYGNDGYADFGGQGGGGHGGGGHGGGHGGGGDWSGYGKGGVSFRSKLLDFFVMRMVFYEVVIYFLLECRL